MALTATQSKSIDGAARYFREGLSQGDYYTAGTEIVGRWNGLAAEALGLGVGSKVTEEQFKRLLSGVHPVTGKKLVQRLRRDRRPCLDLTFSVPKSVSLAWGINCDEEIRRVLEEAVHETMQADVEPLMCRRVRNGVHASTQQRKRTGKIVYGDFLHTTARPVQGQAADPHLHIHCVVLNVTDDDGRFFAAEPEEIFRQRASLQAKFEARLARKLIGLDYSIADVSFAQSGRLKRGWEIATIERSTIEKFSRRTQQIEDFAEKHGITDAARKGELGAKVRSRKDTGASLDELREIWRSKLSVDEGAVFDNLKSKKAGQVDGESQRAHAAVTFALEHHLYRQSAVEKHVILQTALEQGISVSPEAVEKALGRSSVIEQSINIRGDDRVFITTHEVLDAEREMIAFARDGRGTRRALSPEEHVFKREWLNEGQKSAVTHLLKSRDTVMLLTGGAGTGKSSLMTEAVEGIEANGKKVHTFAPSTGACEVLQEKGFAETNTVEHLLKNEKRHPELRNGVLWIDEAGLLDVRSTLGVFRIAKEQNCRVILSGDARQHSSPRRGEALRLCQQEAGLDVAYVQEVQRQKGRYKQAVELVSLGHEVIDHKSGLTGMLAGFDLLDRLGKIKEISGEDRHEALAAEYLKLRKKKRSTLIVSPTHAEKDAVTERIRTSLRDAGAIGGKDVEFSRLKSLNLSEAEKADIRSYRTPGTIVQFHQNVAGFRRGERYQVCVDTAGEPALRKIDGGACKTIPLAATDRFDVYSNEKISFSVGDHVRFTLGGKSADHRRISNGRLDEIEKFDAEGNIVLKSGMIVSPSYGHLDHGYVLSSHAAQGKDRTIAMAAMGSESLPAINAKQFYVTASRGSEDVAIYVDDKQAIRRAIAEAVHQLSATELMKADAERSMQQHRQQAHRHFVDRVREWWQKNRPQQVAAVAARPLESGTKFSPAPTRS